MMKNKRQRQRFKLVLEYDGTRYSGWQRQNNAKTIQGALLNAGAAIFNDPNLDIQGNGRTDAGVHALHYVAHLDTVTDLSPATIMEKLNNLLPTNIAVRAVEPAHPRFHARHTCVGRSYLYQISKRKTTFEKKYAWWVRDRLDTHAMDEAGQLFAGMHDFASFAEKQELKKSTKVLINAIHFYEDDDLITIRVVGSHFLWKMIRRMVGILVEVGRHKLKAEDIEAILNGPSDLPARLTAPASGLLFERAFYGEKEFRRFLSEVVHQV